MRAAAASAGTIVEGDTDVMHTEIQKSFHNRSVVRNGCKSKTHNIPLYALLTAHSCPRHLHARALAHEELLPTTTTTEEVER